MPEKVKSNPYGVSDLANLRRSNGYYVDRTDCIPALEELHYQLFLRPRRFGKSLLVSILHYYYDVLAADRFDELFGGTWIHAHPTADRNSYMVLRFDFSEVRADNLEELQQRFGKNCLMTLQGFARRYRKWLTDGLADQILAQPSFDDGIKLLKEIFPSKAPRVFILIDEYDNFANHVLAQQGEEAYRLLCHGEGFYKSFFAILKAQSAAVTNIFLTGVSPMALDWEVDRVMPPTP